MNSVETKVDLSSSKFFKFIFCYLLNIRHKMWHKSGVESEGQYLVTQELIKTLNIIENAQQFDREALRSSKKHNLLKLTEFSIEESDILMTTIYGAEFETLSQGNLCKKGDQLYTILGFAEKWTDPS